MSKYAELVKVMCFSLDIASRKLKPQALHQRTHTSTHREYIHNVQSVAFWKVNGLQQHLAHSSAGVQRNGEML